jgi:hypothetical protein
MSLFTVRISDCIESCRQGQDRYGAREALIETDHAILPELIETFRAESDTDVREFLVEIIWQHRQPSIISFLGETLGDSEPRVWQQAIDGLVALASPAALEVLRKARVVATGEFRSWLDEAIEQVEELLQEN